MIHDLILKNRSYRRFDNNYQIETEVLKSLINLARLSPSARNSQALKYVLITNSEDCKTIYPNLNWAGYLTNWHGPIPEERPTAYIIMMQDHQITNEIFCDDGIALQSILLGAVEKGLGGCIIGSFKKTKIETALSLPSHLEPRYIIALGKPIEEIIIDEITNNRTIYWRDENQRHHVPKRSLEEIIHLTKE